MDGDAQGAICWLREAVRRSPADGDTDYVFGEALVTVGSAGEAYQKRSWRDVSSQPTSSGRSARRPRPSPKGLEWVTGDLERPHAQRIEATLATGERCDQRELAWFYLDRGRLLFEQKSDRGTMADLKRTLYLSPYQTEAHLLIGHLHLRNGRMYKAIDALKISLWSAETVQAYVRWARRISRPTTATPRESKPSGR